MHNIKMVIKLGFMLMLYSSAVMACQIILGNFNEWNLDNATKLLKVIKQPFKIQSWF